MVKAIKQSRYVGLMTNQETRLKVRELKEKTKYPLHVIVEEAIQEYYERKMEVES